MILNIITVNRKKNRYLAKTIQSLRASDWGHAPVNLIMGSADEGHVKRFNESYHIEKWDNQKAECLTVSFCQNYIRALRHRPEEDAVICEDDVEFNNQWFNRLALAVQEIPISRYVLSLYTANDLSHPFFHRGKHYRFYPGQIFWGTQAVYYPAAVRLEIARYIEENIERAAGDRLVGDWCAINRCLYSTQGSLVQHKGFCTTGLGAFHSAWNYQRRGGLEPLKCRHRAEEVSPGVYRCTSPKLLGLKLVSEHVCRVCSFRDHQTKRAAPSRVPHLLSCFYLGPSLDKKEEEAPTECRSGSMPLQQVHECSHPNHSRTTLTQCQGCADYLFPLITELTPVAWVRTMLQLPPRPQPEGWWLWHNVQAALRTATDEIQARAPAYPGGYRGRGIVIVGGGNYFASSYVTIRVLRHLGCRLPIQLWHWNDELTEPMRQALSPYNVECVNADEVAREWPFRFLRGHWHSGWQLKPYAIAHSRFREVLYLDADCYPTRDPAFLFDWQPYRKLGAIFWPDLETSQGYLPEDRWEIFGSTRGGPSLDSGQILIDKRSCWAELQLTLWYNSQADLVYNLLWGDKDTFNMAWARHARPFSMPQPTSSWDTHTILQQGPDGEVLFQHRCRDKFRLDNEHFTSTPQTYKVNQFNPRLALEENCFTFLQELSQLLKGSNQSQAEISRGHHLPNLPKLPILPKIPS